MSDALERLLKKALDRVAVAVVGVDANGNIAFMSAAAQQLTGWKEAEACGLSENDARRAFGEHTGDLLFVYAVEEEHPTFADKTADFEEGQDAMVGRALGGRLLLRRLIGSGSCARVYRAHHSALDKDVAVKILHPGVSRDAFERFRREARAASRIDHPNSVRILDFDEEGPLLYLVMELVDGEPLDHKIAREGMLPVNRALHVTHQILAALIAAERAGVVHRDLKPSNVMVSSRDFVKVCDFGIAKIIGDQGGLNTVEGVFGTPSYLAPEQAMGKNVDARADLYAAGVILYELVSGAPPFVGEARDVIKQQMLLEPPPLTETAPSIDARISKIAHRALAKRPDDRYQSASEMMAHLSEVLTSF